MSDRREVNARVLRDQAGEWLERRDRPDWSAGNQAEFDAWLAASPENLLAYWRVEGAWERAQRLRVLRSPNPPAPNDAARKRGRSFAGVIAAVVGIATVASLAFAFFAEKSHEQIISTPIGGHKVVALRDGSSVELNTDTVLRVDVAADHRLVTIEKGEAYFLIAHDAKYPFVVAARDHRITVLGTKFVVRQNSGRLEVDLLDGRVWVDESGNRFAAHGILLAPGDALIATADSITREKKAADDIQSELSWRDGMLIFRHATLADAAAEMNRYNAQKLIVADAATARLKIIGTFPTNGIEMFVRASRQLFNLRVENRGTQIVLSR